MPTRTEQTARRAVAELAATAARREAVQAILDGRPEDARPDSAHHVARLWATDALAAETVHLGAIRRAALGAIRNGDIHGAVRVLRNLPPRELAPLAEILRQVGRRRGRR